MAKKEKQLEVLEESNCGSVEIFGSAIHGHGVRATRDIEAGESILQYFGEKIGKEESNNRGWDRIERAKETGDGAVYIFELDEKWDLDGNIPGNTARLINHSCEPNCEAVNYDNEIWIDALADIKAGEELTFDYGYGLDDFLDHPCRCGAPSCIGYIVHTSLRKKVRQILRKKHGKRIR